MSRASLLIHAHPCCDDASRPVPTSRWWVQCQGQLSRFAGALAAGVHHCGCCCSADPKVSMLTAQTLQRWKPLQLPAWPMRDCQLAAHLLSRHRPWHPLSRRAHHLVYLPQPLWHTLCAGCRALLLESSGCGKTSQARSHAGLDKGQAGSSHCLGPERRKLHVEVHGYCLLEAAGLMAGSLSAPALAQSAAEHPLRLGA